MVDIAGIFGDNLARERRAAGFAQEELSVRSSLHRTEVSQLERGLRVPRIDTLIKLAASLEIEASKLLVGIRWQPGETRYGQFSEKRPEPSE